MVSLHIAAYNEPPDMLIATIRSVEQIDYPNFELVVIDNNTEDEETWRPVEEYCRDRDRVRFVHVSPLEGYKSGALNLVLREHSDPEAALLGRPADIRIRRSPHAVAGREDWVEAWVRIDSPDIAVLDMLALGAEVEVLHPPELRTGIRKAGDPDSRPAHQPGRSP